MQTLTNRRSFLKSAAGSLGISFFPWGCSKPHRPNILLILVDDLSKEWISCYGAEDIKTPNVDRLARTGLKFDNAYSMAQCTPSRATLLTGRYPFNTGWVNHWDVPRWGVGYFDWKHKRNMTFARLLREAGYATCAAGKWQINDFRLVPDAMRKHGFDSWCMWTGGEGGNPPSDKRYWDPYINTPDGSKTWKGRFGPDVYCDHLISFIEKNKAKPMLLYFPMALTHTPLTATPDEPNVSTKMAKHKAMVRYMDKLLGRLLDALEKHNLRENTFVFFTTDNGTTRGISGHRHGHLVNGAKGQKSEAGVCQPYIVSCPGTVPQGKTTDALTDFSDLFPTFCELAGVQIPEGLDGVSIAPLVAGRADDSPREWILSMGHGPAKLDEQGVRGVHDYASRVLRDKRFKVWVNESGKIDQLYDLLADPNEQENLIGSGMEEHKQALENFQRIIAHFPKKDARPLYDPRPANPWDRTL